jgi:hypothetical protein
VLVAVLAVLAALAVGCSSGGGGRSGAKPWKTYFDAVAAGKPAVLHRSEATAAPGSPARLYLQYLEASAATGDGSVSYDGDRVRFCPHASKGDCTDYDHIEVDDHDRVTGFDVAGVALDQRIRGAGQPVTTGSITVTLQAAYQSAHSGLVLVVDVTNHGSQALGNGTLASTYVGADGHLFDLSVPDTAFTGDIAPGATATQTITFRNAHLGGKLHFHAYAGDAKTKLTAIVPVG